MDFLVDLRGKMPSVRADEEIEQDEVTVSKHPPVNKLVDQGCRGARPLGAPISVRSSIPDKPHDTALSVIRTASAPVGG